MVQKHFDKVVVNIYDTREEMGEAAAREASECIKKVIARERRNQLYVCGSSISE